jgi:hypothetical protein
MLPEKRENAMQGTKKQVVAKIGHKRTPFAAVVCVFYALSRFSRDGAFVHSRQDVLVFKTKPQPYDES